MPFYNGTFPFFPFVLFVYKQVLFLLLIAFIVFPNKSFFSFTLFPPRPQVSISHGSANDVWFFLKSITRFFFINLTYIYNFCLIVIFLRSYSKKFFSNSNIPKYFNLEAKTKWKQKQNWKLRSIWVSITIWANFSGSFRDQQ